MIIWLNLSLETFIWFDDRQLFVGYISVGKHLFGQSIGNNKSVTSEPRNIYLVRTQAIIGQLYLSIETFGSRQAILTGYI